MADAVGHHVAACPLRRARIPAASSPALTALSPLRSCRPPPAVTGESQLNVSVLEAVSIDDIDPDGAVGGDTFGNREGLLPNRPANSYAVADLDYVEGYQGRGANCLRPPPDQ